MEEMQKTNGTTESVETGESMPEQEDFRVVADLFRQLADPSRIRIYWLLCHYEACVMEIAGRVGMSSPAVAHHLKLLKDNGLVEGRKQGREVYYRASESAVAQTLHEMIEDMMEISCPGGDGHEH